MRGYTAIGLGTDEPVRAYCLERGIPLLDFPIAERERPPRAKEREHFSTIPVNDLYALVEEAGLPEREFVGMPLFLWGSSRHHHITHGLLRKVIDPLHESYSILMMDNHMDDAVSRDAPLEGGGIERIVDCATHLRDSMGCPELKTHCRTAMVVNERQRLRARCLSLADMPGWHWYDLTKQLEKELYPPMFPSLKGLIGGRREPVPREIVRLLPVYCDQEVYVSIDIDALSRDVVDINSHEIYLQGNMQLDDMLCLLDATLEKRHVIGMDINGMTPDPRSRQVYDSILAVVESHRT